MSQGPISRMKVIAEIMHSMGIVPWIEKQVQNNQQYLSQEKYYRILGRTAQFMTQEQLRVLIGPQEIQGQFDIQALDGSLPVDKLQVAQTWIQLLGIMSGRPEVFMQYNLGAIIREIAISLGRKNIDDFLNQPQPPVQAQVLPNEEIERRAGTGNLIPFNEVFGAGGGGGGISPVGAMGSSPMPNQG